MKRWLALFLALVLCLGMLPAAFAEGGASRKDLWNQIKAIENQAVSAQGANTVEGYEKAFTASLDRIAAVIEASPAYVKGSLVRYPDALFWRTTDGVSNGYHPAGRAERRDGVKSASSYVRPAGIKAGISQRDVAVFQPFLGIDENFTDHYRTEGTRLSNYLGGTCWCYNAELSTIDNIAYAISTAGMVLIDSHGSYYEYNAANYLCLTNGNGITSEDMEWEDNHPHAYDGGDTWIVDGTAIANHMTAKAPNNFVWCGICNGMTTDTVFKPLRAKGVAVVLGYSESVSFTADRLWLSAFDTKMIQGAMVKDAVAYMKDQVGCPDPYVSDHAYPLVVSAEDAYPGTANRNQNQTVKSTWTTKCIGLDPSVPVPKITSQPKSVSVPKGQSTTFKVTATGTGLKYQWQYRKAGQTAWTDWSGATTNSLTITASDTNNGCQYRCVVSNKGGHVNSAAATLTVTAAITKPTITAQPKDVSVAMGTTATMKVSASGSGLKYQWQYRKVGHTGWTDWSGRTSASVSITASETNNGCQYRCVVSNSAGSVNSAAARLTVSNVKPLIISQPSDASAALGKTVTFKVVVVGAGMKYQWQYRKAGETTWHNWDGKTSASVTVTTSKTNNGCQYRCKYSNSYGGANSAAARLTVTDIAPTLISQPSDATAAVGQTATFKIEAVGYNVKYQWQYRKAGETAWTDWAGQTGATFKVTASATNNGCQYRCKYYNASGSANSAAVRLTVSGVKPTVCTQPSNASAAVGKTATFKVVAAGTGLKYQWQYRKAGETDWHDWSGKTSATLTVTASSSNSGCQYRCKVSNSCGSVVSAAAKLTVK